MADRNSDIFHISLMEIAYTIIMVLVLLLGARLYEYAEREKTNEDKLAEQAVLLEKKAEEIAALRQRLETVTKQLATAQSGPCQLDEDDPVTTMMPCVKCIARQGNLTQAEAQVATDLSVELMETWRKLDNRPNLSELKKALEQARPLLATAKPLVEESRYQALAAQSQEQARSLKEAKAQAEYFRRRSGIDLPPCWMDESGRSPQYLLSIRVDAKSRVHVSPAWPQERNDEAKAIPGLSKLLNLKTMSLNTFARHAAPILQYANAHQPEACRYYVRLRNDVPDRRGADRARLKIENFFYKYEVHR